MAKSAKIFSPMFFILGLITVNLMVSEIILVEGAKCYRVLENAKCPDGKDLSCSGPCKKRCAASTGVCIDTPALGRICACTFIAPDCQKQHVCS
ncbi:hypothetical protein M9H77_01469 [Catharanthus roseus]|uniref:Uncharacterized protein n=1 Tax=Catharanthus roseus TaxID=4058 RepID=A0ACC0C5K3_CATRO|nr:hypothetical protein M9H77_01469 [Catharanthus roseus]